MAEQPGAGRPYVPPRDYDHRDVEHVLGVRRWEGWEELLEWLRAEAINDPELSPDVFGPLRQDAERACARGAEFTSDAARLYQELRRR
ncbi:hypothetical protein LX15_001056 [Streptoalloteichus tenebrarius]|uniref:Uncharacterized protein n=1 Tax=Streptoalloteichus tenebrarius (strain ATCC 17920 / DSM 40477 / JCM 4838 / CBS 697.72 / NBRC 16177 / NCIMB 11028 / NRRL B-12390 / A12253. 1 / ISP 5477) TaxID=1933 RepID=A0ABT1HPD0_STRSD|nr:hypothetical protein [Streptoalloteichus tenebrarius]MCP2257371.1 hypothetical protein [Streptoalloteichus tenebrarius]BFF04286.1 hypothetical protein GCM10020241_59610 [Streptoalloteichus tenebrarius]